MKRIEYAERDFAWTRWTVAEIGAAAERVIAGKRAALDQVKAVSDEERTFENVVAALDASDRLLGDMYRIGLLMNVSPEAAVRTAAAEALERIEAALVDIEYDEALYQAVEAVATQIEASSKILGAAENKLLQDRLRTYRRMGFALPKEKQATLKANLKRLSELRSAFSKNINEYQDAIEVTREELTGLPEDYITHLKRTPEGKYLVSLEYPEFFPFLENAENETKRAELAAKKLQKGGRQNMDLLTEIVRLRDENARLLGYANHGDFRTEEKMVKSSEQAFEFMRDIMEKVAGRTTEEIASMREWKRRHTNNPEAELLHSDTSFAINRMTRERFAIDKESLRAYFPLEKVKREMFEIFGELLGVRFEHLPSAATWHESVETYRTRDTKTGEVLAYFFLDLFPREGKYGHAAVFELTHGHAIQEKETEAYVCPSVALLMNVPAPTAHQAAYLSHGEIETLFHEFGHLLHETLYAGKYISQSGFLVAHDFVETPSQMLEHWAWQPEILKRISEHRETGWPLDEATIAKMLEAKRFLSASATMRQMVMSLFDMRLHTRSIEGDINREYVEMVAHNIGVKLPEGQLFAAGFGHLMEYDAGYYGYMWAKVYADDFFSRFESEGILDTMTGQSYREQVLAVGASHDELTIANDFLGREPNNEAFIKELGL